MSLILFAITLFIGLMLVSLALVWMLVEVMGGMVAPLFIVGGILLVISVTVYLLTIRSEVARWQQRLDTVYEVSATMDAIAKQVVVFIKKILG